MKRAETLSRGFMITVLLLAVGVPVLLWIRTPLIHVNIAEDGGWSPDALKAEAGQPFTLHLTSDDVMHGFAVGQLDMKPVDVPPGKVTDVTLTFEKAGSYTFYCTRWCGLNHWRMRGIIEVTGSPSEPGPVTVPLYVSLNLDIDAPHEAPFIPDVQPSAIRGEKLVTVLPVDKAPEYYRSHSPYQAFHELSNISIRESQRWDVVAYLWQSNTTRESLASGQRLYAQNCAACHGENGNGDGVFSDDLAAAGKASMQTMNGSLDMSVQGPVDFTDPKRMLAASPALLQGKILRGGMGTGMPMWGSILTEEQIWDLVAYIYSFQFEYEK